MIWSSTAAFISSRRSSKFREGPNCGLCRASLGSIQQMFSDQSGHRTLYPHSAAWPLRKDIRCIREIIGQASFGSANTADFYSLKTFSNKVCSHVLSACRLWFAFCAQSPQVMRATMMSRNVKEDPMNSQVSFQTPKQAEIDMFIAQAHQMRSEYIARLFKSGFNRLSYLFAKKRSLGQASA